MSGAVWVSLALVLVTIVTLLLLYPERFRFIDHWNAALFRVVVAIRTGVMTGLMVGINAVLASRWTVRFLRLGTIAALAGLRRWRHLLTFIAGVIAVEWTVYKLSVLVGVPRPIGIRIIGSWRGYAFPSAPEAALAVTLVGMTYAFLPQGRPREIGKWVTGGLLALLWFARVYLAQDRITDDLAGIILGAGIPVVAFRFLIPNEVFPLTYRRARAAHLDVGGQRGEAIRKAVQDQLGFTVLEVKPVGLEGSGGSTPLRLRVAAADGEPERFLFAKLYAKSHVRADRSYKLGRAIRYGALEDEAPFQTVRRFVEYEDYTLLLFNHLGIPTPTPYGFVEITPEREYMIVMEFFDGAKEISEAAVDERVVESGLFLIRKLWDAGVAHRDIKPANLMVRDGKVLLIDVFFAQVRPSPWRQAVDLANMMLVLAVRSDAELVYRRALEYFTEDEIAEAFAATRGVASPTQLRLFLKRDHRDLVGEFRALAPQRRQVAIQRWSLRRGGLALGVLAGAAVAVFVVVKTWTLLS
jgi:tRNA A-37 threonylcarbamoyl transferase component Bud32